MIHLEEKDKKMLFEILGDKASKFQAFGSRVKGSHKKFSDLDLVYMNDLSDLEIAELRENFENSNISIKIDIVNYQDCSEGFREIIDRDKVKLN